MDQETLIKIIDILKTRISDAQETIPEMFIDMDSKDAHFAKGAMHGQKRFLLVLQNLLDKSN